jgi:hypothetical protein
MTEEDIKSELPNDSVELLRTILEHEQHRTIDYTEAQTIAESLIAFYETLASEAGNL